MADGSDTWGGGQRSEEASLRNQPKRVKKSPLSNYGDPGTSLGGDCWLADGSRRRGRRSETEEEKGWERACQRGRGAGGRWGRDAEASWEDGRLEDRERHVSVLFKVLL